MAFTLNTSTILTKLNKKSNYYCCVPQCKSNGRLDLTLSFHHIPKDEELKTKWMLMIGRDEGPMFHISKSTVVCSKHFTKEDYTGWGPVKRRLKRDAFPSIFDLKDYAAIRHTLKRQCSSSDKEVNIKRFEQGDAVLVDVFQHKDLEDGEEKGVSKVSREEMPSPVSLDTAYEQNILELKEELKQKSDEIHKLNKQLIMEKFFANRFCNDDKMIQFYTGFNSYILFLSFFKFIEPTANNMQSKYYAGVETISLVGRKRNMLLIDEFFMFLCRLKVGLLEQDLGVRFNCSLATVSRKIVTWVNFLYVILGRIPIWLPRRVIDDLMPECFKSLYPKTRVIIDCTEIRTQQPSSLVLRSQLYSKYKGACTFKCLLGIAPHGAISFISSLFTGCISDVEIAKLSGILDLLEPDDSVMADKGFTLCSVLSEKGATLNIPPFLSSKLKFMKSEIKVTEQIAKLRIHVERVNRRVKEYHLFDVPIPLSLTGSANQLWAVACMLTNFRGPIVKSWQKNK